MGGRTFKIGPVVLPLWVVENRPSPLLWPLAYTTACTTVQAVMLLGCLSRKVYASCHTLRRRTPPSTNTSAYQRLVSVAAECIALFTARDGATYWLRITIFACPICIRRPHYGVPVGLLVWRWVS